jgi:SAM-dependent methyltransferase
MTVGRRVTARSASCRTCCAPATRPKASGGHTRHVLRAEAAWLQARLEQLPDDDLSPLLSIGSGGRELRSTQPWIEEVIYAPLARRGVKVLHHELEPADGVDVAGDLTDRDFFDRLSQLQIRSVLCSNVLEHVPNRDEVAAGIERIVAPGGYALVSVPRRYPYHPGPIDTLFRPTPDELRSLFPNLVYESGAEIRTESLLRYLFSSSTKWASLARGLRTKSPAAAPNAIVERFRMAFVSTAVTAVVLRAPVVPSPT